MLNLPIDGPALVPESFDAHAFWTAITCQEDYVAKGAKASGIQNPCFKFSQKALAYTLFCRGDRNGVATQRELFLLHSMANQTPVSVAGFAADYLGRVARATSGAISIGGMIS